MPEDTQFVKILMIEDDYESMAGLMEHLENKGYLVIMTAEEEIKTRLRTEHFDLILLDQMIHTRGYDLSSRAETTNLHFDDVNWKNTGLEFLRRLRLGEFSGPAGTMPSVPVIVVSAVANSKNENDQPANILTNYYIEKPFRLHEMMSLISTALQR